MRVLYALFCEAASARPDDRVDFTGTFRQLFAPGFPAMQDHLVIAVALEWDSEEPGPQPFRMDLIDPAGTPAFTISGHTDISAAVPGQPPPLTRLVMPLEEVVFQTAGTYVLKLFLGDAVHVLAPIHLVEHPDA